MEEIVKRTGVVVFGRRGSAPSNILQPDVPDKFRSNILHTTTLVRKSNSLNKLYQNNVSN
jgi:hypothetical protein